MDPEARQQNKEVISERMGMGAEAVKTGVTEAAGVAKETIKSGA